MPLFGTRVGLNSDAITAGTQLANGEYIAGVFKTYSTPAALATAIQFSARFNTGQIAYVSSSNELFICKSTFDGGLGENVITTSSFQFPGAGTTNTGSLLVTASIAGSDITFEKGDGSTFTLTLPGGGGSGIFVESGSSGVFAVTSSLQITGSTLGISPLTTTGANITASNSGTGGGSQKYALISSQSVWHYSDNIGVPTSKAWGTDLDGSYFKNFDQNTDTAEIVRFMAGLLSSSAPDASPNTKTFNNIGEHIINNTIGTAPLGRTPGNTTNSTLTYLISQTFTSPGQSLFDSVGNIYTNASFNISYSSSAAGTTIVSSSNDSQLFGLGTIGLTLDVSGSTNFTFENNNGGIVTNTSQSSEIISKSGTGTSNGLTIGNINTNNPLIPNAFQDGKFTNIFSSGLYNNGISLTTKESIGFYEISASITLQTGSNGYLPVKNASERIFYAPVSTLNTNIPDNTITLSNPFSESISATSRSLSGAPYLQTANYHISNSISGLFNPMYAAATVARLTESDDLISLSHPTNGAYSASIAGGTIQTENAVFTSAGVVRNLNDIPNETDIVRLTSSISFNAGTSQATNIQTTGLGTTSFSVISRTTNKNSTETIKQSDTFNYFNVGTFNQPTDSGSLAYYGYPQDGDPGTLQGTSETFKGEKFRIQIVDSLLTGQYSTAGHFNTSSYSEYNLAKYDLQVKPGNLIFPGGNNEYWLANPDTSTDYKYYARAFQADGNTKTQISFNAGVSLIDWNSSTDGVAAAIMFESAQQGTAIPSGGGALLPRAKLYDFSKSSGGDPAVNQAPSDQLNPFSVNIDVGINFGGSKSGTTYSMPLTDTLNMLLNNTYRNYIILIRYKGDPTPLQNILINY